MKMMIAVCFALSFLSSVVAYDLERDPFQPMDPSLISHTSTSSGATFSQNEYIKLTGIIWDEDEPMGMIEFRGKKRGVLVGDFLGNVKVEAVRRQSILLKDQGKTITLNLGEELRF